MEWYLKCTLTRSKCRHLQSNFHALPTRLIDVGSHASQEPRLVITKELSPQATPVQYLTLSHSWGSGVPMKLLKDNLETLESCIPFERLSQTFRDAILVTRRLGFRYLWIDSLCIIQDCTDDWRRESASMRDVYKGGICNIAATAASNGADGLFTKRDPWPISPFTIDISGDKCQKRYRCFQGAVRYDGFIKAPLSCRGWVYQEQLMSPRTTHFSTQLFWECKELEACETDPMGLSTSLYISDYKGGLNSRPFQEKSWLDDISNARFDSNPRTTRYKIWTNTVVQYTCCALTCEGDKLIAISGLVKEIQPLMEDEYVCGLWRQDLINEMCWHVLYSKQADRTAPYRPQNYRGKLIPMSETSISFELTPPEQHHRGHGPQLKGELCLHICLIQDP